MKGLKSEGNPYLFLKRENMHNYTKHLLKKEKERIESCLEDQASWIIFHIPFLSLSDLMVV